MDRRDFLRLAGGAAALAATGFSCSGDDSDDARAADATSMAGKQNGGERTLRIAQWTHFVPAYNAWFDDEFCQTWGEEHDVRVVVDHLSQNELPARAEVEATDQRGHDLFWFLLPRPGLEDHVIDHREIVEEVTAKFGPMLPHVERSVRNPKTGRYFGFPDLWTAGVANFRVDLWDRVTSGLRPRTWDDVRAAGGALRDMGHPLGLSMSAGDYDSEIQTITLLQSFGGRLQDEDGNLAVNSPATVDAVRFGAELFRAGMTDEVLSWDSSGNNRSLATGRASFILNAVSAVRAAEQQDRALAAKIMLAPAPIGPAGDVPRCGYVVGSWVVWKFAREPELAKQFMVDLAFAHRESFIRSRFYNLPPFPGAAPDLAGLLANDADADPTDKYALLAEAAPWHTTVGHPGSFNAPVDEAFGRGVIARMFATAARGAATPEEAVRTAEAEMRPIFDKWRELGKI